MKISRKRKRQFIGMMFGIFLTSCAYTLLSIPSNEKYLSKGPVNTGHEELECSACHSNAKGNVFQQIQANIMFMAGMRGTEADFGKMNVDNTKCLSCHDRPNDRHPGHRFLEPRFEEARIKIAPQQCESCHKEHNGVRLTITNTGYCINCHEDLKVKKDPLEISHEQLIKQGQWTTCLQCHDFHGNHKMETAQSIKDTIPVSKIIEYIKGGVDPYSFEKKYKAVKTLSNGYSEKTR